MKDYSWLLDEDKLDAELKRHFEKSKTEHDDYVMATYAGMSPDQANRYVNSVKRIKAYEKNKEGL